MVTKVHLAGGTATTKLHLGCGSKIIDGFVNIDSVDRPGVDDVADIRNLPDRYAGCTMIYACHVLEHLGRHEWEGTLRSWHRLLAPGGLLRLAVPDFMAIAERYMQQGDLSELLGLLIGNQRDGDYHKMIWDHKTLFDALLYCGYKNVHTWNWREADHKHVDDFSQAYLPHMDKENGQLMSLNLEASK